MSALRFLVPMWFALIASPALAALDGAVIMPGVSTTSSVLSFLRFSNSDGAAHPASVMLHHPDTGEMLATWTSSPIPAGGTAQVAILDILPAASPALNPAALPPTLVVAVSGFIGHVQHATWIAASNAWLNATACGMAMMADNLSLPYVTGPGQPAFKGFVRITNGTAAARALTLTFIDNAERAFVWRSSAIASGGAISAGMSEIAQQSNPPIAADVVSLTVVSESAPPGIFLSYSEAVTSSTTFSDFSGGCMVAVGAPVTHDPPAGSAGGSTGHNMTMSAPASKE